MSKGFFDIDGGDYWTDPWKNLKDIAWNAMTNGTPAFALDAPPFVPLDERKTIPLLAFQADKTTELARKSFEDLVLVAVIDLTENRLLAQRLPRPSAPPAPAEPATPGFACLEYKLELTDLFNIPWQASSYIATAFLREQVSNRVTIKLGRSETGFDDPEVLKFLEARRQTKPPRWLNPPALSPIVRHGPGKNSLPVPGETGIAMQIERVLVATEEVHAWLEVSFRLPVSKTDVLPPPENPPIDAGPPPETARAVVSLLIFGSDSNVPLVSQLIVPSFDKVEGEADAPVAKGTFAIDITKLGNLANSPQTYYVYAFSGTIMSGPAIVAFVDPALLPVIQEEQTPPTR